MTTEHPRPDQTEAAIPAAEPLKDGDIVAFDGASTPDEWTCAPVQPGDLPGARRRPWMIWTALAACAVVACIVAMAHSARSYNRYMDDLARRSQAFWGSPEVLCFGVMQKPGTVAASIKETCRMGAEYGMMPIESIRTMIQFQLDLAKQSDDPAVSSAADVIEKFGCRDWDMLPPDVQLRLGNALLQFRTTYDIREFERKMPALKASPQ